MFIRNVDSNSIAMVDNIAMNIRNSQIFAHYTVRTYMYDYSAGVYAMEVSNNGVGVNLYLFYPDVYGTGKFGSIALYGQQLENHYIAMRSSMSIFGLKITDISKDSGKEDFLDIYIEY